MDPNEEIRQTFFMECEDLLEVLEAGLMAISEGDDDLETVNSVFRAVHSIKGGAGAFALDNLVRFAHKFETTLDEVRSQRLEMSADLIRLLLRAADLLADLVRVERDGESPEMGPFDEAIDELEAFRSSSAEEDAIDPAEADFQPMTLAMDFDDIPEVTGPSVFKVVFKPKSVLYARGNETALLLRALSTFGEVISTCNLTSLPDLAQIEAETAYLEWELLVETEADVGDIFEVFEFVEGDCELSIEAATSSEIGNSADDTVADTTAVEVAEVDQADAQVEVVLKAEHENPPEAKPSKPVDVEADTSSERMTDPESGKKSASVPSKAARNNKEGATSERATVRVDLDRVDRLINLVGELVINQSMLAQCVSEAGLAHSTSVSTGLDEFKQLTREIQESVMAIRAQPVKSLFQRMSRIVREAADATGKNVRLKTEGETVEVDKTVIERLADPLTHMIRNAVDHGLESPQKREDSGKTAEGSVWLTAAHRSGRVVIEVSDDGAGINRERVRSIAIEKGLIPEDAQMSNSEIDNLLFMPGFSTAKEISNLSGRGVGMDVVKKAIQSLGGRISISSTPGEGSVFSISLPLTLAVLDGMVVEIAGQTVVVPLTAIVETLKPSANNIHGIGADGRVLFVRGEFVPIIDVAAELGFADRATEISEKVILLTESDDGPRCAFLVDAINDQRQVVIKGLEDNYGHVPGVAAATILGDGRIALILDADALVSKAGSTASQRDLNMALAG